MTLSIKSALGACGLLLLGACSLDSSSTGDSENIGASASAVTTAQTLTAQLTLPASLAESALLAAQDLVQLDSAVNLDSSVWSAGTLYVQPDVKVLAPVTVVGNVTLTDRDTISALTLGGKLTKGNDNTLPSVTVKPLAKVTNAISVTFPAASTSVTLNSGQSKTLDPGSYDSVTVNSGGTLTLRAGDYYIASLTLESSATLQLSSPTGATRVFLSSGLTWRPSLGATMNPARFFVQYMGTNTVTLETPFSGSLVVPRAALVIGTASGFAKAHSGTFTARSIEVQPRAKLTRVPFDATGTAGACPAGSYDADGNPYTACVPKTTCSPGTYVANEGTAASNRTCANCPAQTFSATANAVACAPWSPACAAGSFESTPPSPTHDRACAVGTPCPAGTYVLANAGGTTDTKCQPCPSGTFSAAPNLSPQCTPWTVCGPGQVVANVPSSTTDVICGAMPNQCPDGGLGPTMISVPSNYCIDSTEVTRGQYAAWLATNPNPAIGQDAVCAWNQDYAPGSSCIEDGGVCTTPDCYNRPVVCVDWCDAAAFCKAAGKRLCGNIAGGSNDFETSSCSDPTQSQWYAACSSGGTRAYPYGNTYDQTKCQSPYDDDASNVAEVGSRLSCQSDVAGYQGIFDLSGNVWEWEDACTSGANDAFCHLRGGSYNYYGGGPEENAYYATCARCGLNYREYQASTVGFRCCN